DASTSKTASTREAVTLACWPPGPDDREVRTVISRKGNFTSARIDIGSSISCTFPPRKAARTSGGVKQVQAPGGNSSVAALQATEEHSTMPNGTVKWFSDEKGFGFITPDDGGRDLFVHHSSISAVGYRSLSEGIKVSYEEEASPKGPKAINVVKL